MSKYRTYRFDVFIKSPPPEPDLAFWRAALSVASGLPGETLVVVTEKDDDFHVWSALPFASEAEANGGARTVERIAAEQGSSASVVVSYDSGVEPTALPFWIDPGEAPPHVIAEVLAALSDLHEAAGGSGLDFHIDGEYIVPAEVAEL